MDSIELLFGDKGARYGLEEFVKRDRLAGAITGDRDTDLWRAWRAARSLAANARFLESFDRLKSALAIHPLDPQKPSLVDLEINAIIAECATEGNQPLDAYETWEEVGSQLFSIVDLIRNDPARAAGEIRQMLKYVAGVERLRETLGDDDLIGAWVLGRGIHLLLDSFLQRITLSSAAGYGEEPEALVLQAEGDLNDFCLGAGCDLDPTRLVEAEFAFGNCWTAIDPKRALEHFDTVVKLGGLESRVGIEAAANAANCLLRLHRYGEAADRYDSIESLFEMYGDYLGAARVWSSHCLASWHYDGDPSVIDSLTGAIQMFENNLPESSDVLTLYTLKRYMEPAYLLLIAIASDSIDKIDRGDRYETRLNQILGALRALLSRDYKADLNATALEPGWEGILDMHLRPLASLKAALAPFKGTGVVHLCSTPARLSPAETLNLPHSYEVNRLTWIIYGYDRSGKFHFEIDSLPDDQSPVVSRFLEAMEQQLAADLRQDHAQVGQLESELVKLGDLLGSSLSKPFTDLLLSMDHLFFMPVPFADVDEFPLHGLRFAGEWLGSRTTITRTPTFNHLRETLNPNARLVQSGPRAVIVVGNPESGGVKLAEAAVEAARIEHIFSLFGFKSEAHHEAKRSDMFSWLDGGTNLVHYIGHGMANHVNEGLPLSKLELFRALDLSRLEGLKAPFVFLCACEAARVRYSSGGYQIGLASTLVERGAPGVLAFSMPILEARAYHIAHTFYRHAHRSPFGAALRKSRIQLASETPAYAWLALAAYGDPDFYLPAVAAGERAPMSSERGATWHSRLRNYLVLRTDESLNLALDSSTSAPAPLNDLVKEFLKVAFNPSSVSTDEMLGGIERRALELDPGPADFQAGLLSLRAAVCLERAYRIGIDDFPPRFPEAPEVTRRLFSELHFVARSGAALFDTRLNGLAHALLGRLITWDQGNMRYSAIFLKQALEKLNECAPLSPFVARIRQETIKIIEQFGGLDR